MNTNPTKTLSEMGISVDDIDRFWSKVARTGGTNNCWPWIGGSTYPYGYGAFCVNRKNKLAHKVAFLSCGGVLSDLNPFVLHSCHNPACCNPDHLRAGSFQDNADDMVKAGRQCKGQEKSRIAKLVAPRGDNHPSRRKPECLRRGENHPSRLHPENLRRGENHPFAKLSDRQVREIRGMYPSLSQRKLAKRFGIDQTVIGDIVRHQSWRHVV